MAKNRGREDGGGRASGTAGGTDLEPLRAGMREQEKGEIGPEHDHGSRAREASREGRSRAGGLHRRGGNVTREGTPPSPGGPDAGDTRRDPADKVIEERGDHENEAGNAPGYGAPRSAEEP